MLNEPIRFDKTVIFILNSVISPFKMDIIKETLFTFAYFLRKTCQNQIRGIPRSHTDCSVTGQFIQLLSKNISPTFLKLLLINKKNFWQFKVCRFPRAVNSYNLTKGTGTFLTES